VNSAPAHRRKAEPTFDGPSRPRPGAEERPEKFGPTGGDLGQGRPQAEAVDVAAVHAGQEGLDDPRRELGTGPPAEGRSDGDVGVGRDRTEEDLERHSHRPQATPPGDPSEVPQADPARDEGEQAGRDRIKTATPYDISRQRPGGDDLVGQTELRAQGQGLRLQRDHSVGTHLDDEAVLDDGVDLSAEADVGLDEDALKAP